MSGEYKGAQGRILQKNKYALYAPCGAHTLNLAGVDAAECCPNAITFFGVVQKCFNIFSSSTIRWDILKECVPTSLHRLSDTRWSARIDAVKAFAQNLPGLRKALTKVTGLNLTVETKRDVDGIIKYISKFECVLMSSIWFKILTAINYVSLILQRKEATIDVEVKNLECLVADLQLLRSQWGSILKECQTVAKGLPNTSSTLPASRKKKRNDEEPENSAENMTAEEIDFKRNTFLVIMDSVITGIENRFTAIKNINNIFSFLWLFPKIEKAELQTAALNFAKKYPSDVSEEISIEMCHLKSVYKANFTGNSECCMPPFDLLNAITAKNLDTLFPNICIALRIFCTLPVSVAGAERSFSALSRIKDYHRSCSTQSRVTGLATLYLESELARKLDFDDIIRAFASAKARKAKF